MAPRRRCPTCGSKQWHKEPSSGLVACSEGHVLQNYRNETTEITEVGPHAMKKRTLKSGRKKKGNTSNADPKLYHGARGRYHYFLCLQLLLRKQIVALTKLWDLPSEFEIICRDVWALNLALLPDPPPAEPYHHAQKCKADREEEGGGGDPPTSSDAKAKEKGKAKQESDDGSEEEANEDRDEEKIKLEDISDDDQEEEEEEEEEDSEEEDLELEALMQENSDFSGSSSDEQEKGDEGQKHAGKKKPKKKRGKTEYESPISTIAVLVVACWMLRIPVMYRDFTRIIERYEIPYLDGVRKLPGSMVEHLTKHNIQALSPPHAPRTMAVHRVASRLAKKLNKKYGIYTPEMNAASMLWRITKEMGGTPLLYRLTKRVASVLSVPLTLHWTLSPALEREKGTEPFRHQYDSVPPEVGLLGALIIVVKMVHGLDGTTRELEEEDDDVGCGLGSAQAYMRLIEKMTEGDRIEFDTRRGLEVGNMPDWAIDEYISFCAEILGSDGGDGAVDRYFGGVTCSERGAREEETDTGTEGLQKTEGQEERKTERRRVRAGSEYRIWNSRDVDGTLPAEYAALLRLGERTVGVSVGGMLEAFERRLVRWKRR